MNWALVYGLWIMLLSYAISWPLGIHLTPADSLFLKFLGIEPRVNVMIALWMPLMMYYALKRVDHMIPNMNKYSVTIYILIGVWGLNTLVQSLLQWQFVVNTLGILHIAIAFLVPGMYTVKNRRRHQM